MTDPQELRRDVPDDLLDRAAIAGDGRTVDLCLLRWDETADTPQGREAFTRGAFRDTDPASILVEAQGHDGAIVGAGQAIEERADGAYLSVRVSDTTAGNDLLTLVRDGVLRRASITFVPIHERRRPDGVIVRDRVELRRVAILPRGAYRSAGVLAIRTEVPAMTEPRDPDPEPTPTPAPTPPDWSPVLSRLTAQDDAIARLAVQVAGGAGGAPARSELLRFDGLGEAFMAATTDPSVRAELRRALVDNTFAGSGLGLGFEGWLSDVKGLVPQSRPGITAFGGPAALPDQGMVMLWPVPHATARGGMGVQATEKTAITPSLVAFVSDSVSIETYAGGSDISYQVLKRSQPSYRELYARTMLGVWAKVTDNAFVDKLSSLTAATTAWDATADTDGSAFVALLFAESVKVEQATGQPATAVIAATDVFLKIAGKQLLVPSGMSTATALGNATASTLTVSVSGLRIVHDPNLADGKFIIGNSLGARWHEDGPFTVEADDVEKLGKNVAYWGMGAPAVYVPTGVVVGNMTAIAARGGSSTKAD